MNTQQTDALQCAADMATASAQGFRDGVASLTAQADSVLEDAARLDFIQECGATVEILPGRLGWTFRVGGLHGGVHGSVRAAIDAERQAFLVHGGPELHATPTSGAADLLDLIEAYAEARHRQGHSSYNAQTAVALQAVKDALAAAQAVVQDDLITIRKPTTNAEMLWLLKLAHLVISDVDKTMEESFAPAQPAAQQGAAYAALPDERAAFEAQFPVPGGVHWDGTEYVVKDSHVISYRCNRFEGQWEAWKARASHGQAPAQAARADSAPSRFGSPELQAMIIARCVEKDQADRVQEDAACWQWLAEYLVGTRTDLDDEIVASETVNDLRKLVKAAIKQGATQ